MPTGPFQGLERLAHIATLQLSRAAGNSAIEIGEGCWPPLLRPALGSGKASP